MKSQKLAKRNLTLKVAILTSGRTQRATAKRLRMDETRLSKLIAGEGIPTARERAKLARAVGRSEAELFHNDDSTVAAS